MAVKKLSDLERNELQKMRGELHKLQHYSTPLTRHPLEPRLLIKHEGHGAHPAHKFRSIAWLTEWVIDQGIDPRRMADRSSGSMSMGGAKVAHLLGGESAWITVGAPPQAVRAYVESQGGRFIQVRTNPERIAAVDRLRADGWWCPDQHANPLLIDAFANTLGEQIAIDLRREKAQPRFVVAAQGTGATLAGVGRALRRHGRAVTCIGADVSSSIAHDGSRSWKPEQLKVRGAGSDDEICGTLQAARAEIDEDFPGNVFRAAEEMHKFFRISSGCGMSGGLALAIAFDRVLPQCGPDDEVLVILADAPMQYTAELAIANQFFVNPEIDP